MALIFGAPGRKPVKAKDESKLDQRLALAKELYMAGKLKIVTTDEVPNQTVQGTFGLIVSQGFLFENAFYGLLAQAVDVNADAIIGYRQAVAFHPEGDKFHSCYGTAVRLKKTN